MFHRRQSQFVLSSPASPVAIPRTQPLVFDPVLQTAGQVVAEMEAAKAAADVSRAS